MKTLARMVIVIGALVVLIAWLATRDSPVSPAPIVHGPDYNTPGSRSARHTAKVESHTVTYEPEPSEPLIPADEQRFIMAVQEGRFEFRAAANEMAQGGTRARRRSAICDAVPILRISDWVGRIEKLSSNSDGKGVLEISVGPSIRIETWNNDLSDVSDHTLIDPSTPLFASVSQMKEGDQVVFSGNFFSSTVDCAEEHSMSLEGSMTDPEFVFRFNEVRER